MSVQLHTYVYCNFHDDDSLVVPTLVSSNAIQLHCFILYCFALNSITIVSDINKVSLN